MADILEPILGTTIPAPAQAAAQAERPLRTAVIVIAGVGDRPSGSASEALTASLLSTQPTALRSAERVDEEYAPARSWCGEPLEATQTVTRHTLFDRLGQPVADVYEAWWADLSRFPGATRSALLAAVGMLQQATTIGRAALGGTVLSPCCNSRGTAVAASERFGFGSRAVGAVEWLVTVPVVCLATIIAVMLGVADYAMATNGAATVNERAGLAVVAIISVAVLVWAGRWYQRRRPGALLVGLPLIAAGVGLSWAMTVGEGGRADRGIADAVFMLAVYPMRVAWMALAAIALVIVPVLAVQRAKGRGARTGGWARIGTASLSMFGPFGLALVGALVYAAIGAAVQKLAEQSTFGGHMPWCLPSLTSWQPAACSTVSHDITNAFSWGVALFATAIVPMMYVAGWVLVTLALTAVAVLVHSLMQRDRGALSPVVLLRRFTAFAPWGVAVGLIPTAAMVLLAYVPGGDHVLFWQQHRAPGDVGGAAELLAAATAWVIGALLAAARLMKLNRDALLNQGSISEKLRVPLDLAYDIAAYLREPVRRREIVPRQRMLGRIAALLDHVATVREYDQCVIVAHSQGTVLATALLDRAPGELNIPGGQLWLVTMGSPLRHIYAQRLPLQFAWVTQLDSDPGRFVRLLQGRPWENFGADGDLVGRTVFSDEPGCSLAPLAAGDEVGHAGGRRLWHDWYAGPGGHGSYWTSPLVMGEITALLGVPVV